MYPAEGVPHSCEWRDQRAPHCAQWMVTGVIRWEEECGRAGLSGFRYPGTEAALCQHRRNAAGEEPPYKEWRGRGHGAGRTEQVELGLDRRRRSVCAQIIEESRWWKTERCPYTSQVRVCPLYPIYTYIIYILL